MFLRFYSGMDRQSFSCLFFKLINYRCRRISNLLSVLSKKVQWYATHIASKNSPDGTLMALMHFPLLHQLHTGNNEDVKLMHAIHLQHCSFTITSRTLCGEQSGREVRMDGCDVKAMNFNIRPGQRRTHQKKQQRQLQFQRVCLSESYTTLYRKEQSLGHCSIRSSQPASKQQRAARANIIQGGRQAGTF